MPVLSPPSVSDPAGASAAPDARLAPAPLPRLPVWPLTVMFGLVPVWWLAGAFYLGWSLLGAVLLALLLVRGRVPLPPGTGIWLLFLALVMVSATQLSTVGSLLGFGLRLGFYVTALVVGVYVYAVARQRADLSALLVPLCLFWFALVALGWLGVVMPRFTLGTPMEMLLPGGIAGNPYIQDLVRVGASEFSARSLNPIYRPSAPFPYTNNYGSAYAMTLPCVVAFVMLRRRGLLRWALIASLPLSLAPAFLTLNRTMFVSLGAGLLVLGLRAARRGNVRVGASVVGVLLIGGLATLVIPVAELIDNRVESSDTNSDRFALYGEVLRRVAESPWLGYGAPASVDTISAPVPVGTQGQLWMVLFSHGVPALLSFLGWFALVAVICARVRSAPGQWLAVLPVVCLVQMPFYGMASPNLSVAFFAIALTMALVERETRPVGPVLPRPAPRPEVASG
ncbi:O-antigen ligase family protein [Micromonospora radicis]|uniref:O-antigen ligase domain-containing protein n=1 Tax=Micromonospora radicis TaxID=1894971 RepID=A0A418MU20_9ACTN|nr:O-antigen ligase family protein [Micromonospora radicis]RIV37788.1 O-antigen ligase domain-containing protein [Micromonospora radicis]